jgi:hypothetical protein
MAIAGRAFATADTFPRRPVPMHPELARMSLLPSALVLSDLASGRAGDLSLDALERAGFDRRAVEGYLQRRATCGGSAPTTCS